MRNAWFEPGFDVEMRLVIERNWPLESTLICHDEAHRWAKVLLDLYPATDIELHDGLFCVNGSCSENFGHSWLVIEGRIFDPTAAQFEGVVSANCYAAHECCPTADLPRRLDWFFNEFKATRTSNSNGHIELDAEGDPLSFEM